MKLFKMFFVITLVLLLYSPIAVAGDFDWIKDFNITAQGDPSGFKARLSTRFQIGDAKINAVISNVETPADAYMVLRLGEISKQPPEQVIERYKTGKGKGWGALAKSLGIKPGSKEFRVLKSGHDLDDYDKNKDKNRDKGKNKGKGGKKKF